MCGIVGIIARGFYAVQMDTLKAMSSVLHHRGPDGAGCWLSEDASVGFAHRRLSIVDLSSTANQPMHNQKKTVVVSFNGEIYNHQSLRRQLQQAGYVFATDHSDTEVLVHGFSAWGIDGLLTKLEGDFAFLLWDAIEKKAYATRDHVGVKPLYFYDHPQFIAFASEIKSLMQHPQISAQLSEKSMVHYLSFLITPAPLTLFKDVYKIPAGYYLEVSAGVVKAVQYWDALPKTTSFTLSEATTVEKIRVLLKDAVQKRMMTDVPMGVFLSGGIDSTTNLALMTEFSGKAIDTFSVGFKDYKHLNELDYAQFAAKHYGARYHEIQIDSQDMQASLEEMVYSQDEPIADWVCIPLYAVSKLAKDHGIKVVQVGEGADEQFCGYASYMAYLKLYQRYWRPFQKYLPKLAQQTIAVLAGCMTHVYNRFDMYVDIIQRASRDREHFWSGATVFVELMKKKLLHKSFVLENEPYPSRIPKNLLPASFLEPDTFHVIEHYMKRFDSHVMHSDVLNRMIYSEFQLRLPELLLMRVDKMTMANTLEARVPFLDKHLVEFTQSIPQSMKVGAGAKSLLKKVVQPWIPPKIIHRKKMGFAAPMDEWIKGDFGKKLMHDIFSSRLFKEDCYFNRTYIKNLYRDHCALRRNNSLYLWTLYNLAAWHQCWIEKQKIGTVS